MTSPTPCDVYDVFARYLDVPPSAIADHQRLERDLGLDPLDLVLIALRLEEIDPSRGDFPLARLEAAATVGDVAAVYREWDGRDTLESAPPFDSAVFSAAEADPDDGDRRSTG